MAKQTNPEAFRNMWEEYIKHMSLDDMNKWLAETSPNHPNENMRWLYDRLLSNIATNNSNLTE